MNILTSVYLRADGNSKIGLGHVHRLLALAEILNGHFSCKFVIRSPLKGIRDLILKTNDEIIEIAETNEGNELRNFTMLLTGNDIVVLDGYHFGAAYQTKIKETGSGLVCVDDIYNCHFVADIIFNPAGGLKNNVYSVEHYTQIYSGPPFAFLKEPFCIASKHRHERVNNDAIFICMGGADPDNHTLLVLKHFLPLAFEMYYIVVGEAYMYNEQLLFESSKTSKRVRILSSLKPRDLAEVMKLCGTAVCSASGIAYEYLSVGGELYIKETASNQENIYSYLLKEGLAYRLEDYPVSREKIAYSLDKQSSIFDGNSPRRILRVFNQLDFKLHVRIRKADESDLTTFFDWANDPELRQQSFNSTPIPIDTHTAWYIRKINDPSTLLYIFEYKNIPVAQVRFDVQPKEAIVSYSLDRLYRGRGWGEFVLAQGLKKFEQDCDRPREVIGFVKYENESSKKIFMKLGFRQIKANEYPNAFKYTRQWN